MNTMITPAEFIVLISIKPKLSQSKIIRKTNLTYSYGIRLLQKLESMGLIKQTKKGRVTQTQLTEKGERARDLLLKLKEELK